MDQFYTPTLRELPATVPFIGPETLERREGKPIQLRLGANESPFGPSPFAVTAMQEAAMSSQFYGDPECYLLRSQLSAELGIPIENLSVGAGIDELLAVCCRLFISPGDPIVTTLGSYPTFEFGGMACGADFHRIPYRDEKPDLDRLVGAVRATGAKILYLANPDNPSGAWISGEAVGALIQELPELCMLFLDEAYLDFAPEVPRISFDHPRVFRFRTFSKAHGMAGMRVGYVIANPTHIRTLDKIRMHFGVNRVGQAGAVASLNDPSHVADVVTQTEEGRAEITQLMISKGFRPLESHTNFLTVDVGAKHRAEAILNLLLTYGVFIRKPAFSPLDGCVRVTIGRPNQLQRFAEIFESVLKEI